MDARYGPTQYSTSHGLRQKDALTNMRHRGCGSVGDRRNDLDGYYEGEFSALFRHGSVRLRIENGTDPRDHAPGDDDGRQALA